MADKIYKLIFEKDDGTEEEVQFTAPQGESGADGERGTGILKVSSSLTSYTTTTGGKNPIKRMKISTIKSEANVSEVLVGDLISYSYDLYHIYYLDDTYAYVDTYVSIRGATGATGAAGTNGTNGADGKDGANGKSAYQYAQEGGYKGTEAEFAVLLANAVDNTDTVKYVAQTLTDAQKAQARVNIAALGKADISLGIASDGLIYIFVNGVPVGTGIPQGQSGDIHGYIDENNHITLTGNMPDGTYTASFEDENGSVVALVGQLVKDTNVYYSVTSDLTNCTNSNTTKTVVQGGSYSATISANSGYELKSVTVTMGGANVSVTNGVINIASVTGNIVITAVAEEATVTPSYTNLLPLSVNADGSDYKGTNGEDGYKAGYKMSGSSGNESATAGAYCSGFIPVTYSDTVRIKNVVMHGTASVNNIVFYDASKTLIKGYAGLVDSFTALVEKDGGIHWFRPNFWVDPKNCAFFRFSCGGITDETIVTVNEEIA